MTKEEKWQAREAKRQHLLAHWNELSLVEKHRLIVEIEQMDNDEDSPAGTYVNEMTEGHVCECAKCGRRWSTKEVRDEGQ